MQIHAAFQKTATKRTNDDGVSPFKKCHLSPLAIDILIKGQHVQRRRSYPNSRTVILLHLEMINILKMALILFEHATNSPSSCIDIFSSRKKYFVVQFDATLTDFYARQDIQSYTATPFSTRLYFCSNVFENVRKTLKNGTFYLCSEIIGT